MAAGALHPPYAATSPVAPPRQLMNSLGFTPAADATGERRRQGGSPKTGNPQARQAWLEGAWASRDPATVRRPLHLRVEKGPQTI
jgi:transposase